MKNNNKFYKKWHKALISKNFTIEKTIKNLNLTALQICLVVEKNKKLIGTITDGDIRRALLGGSTINDKINKYINYRPKKIFKGFTNNQLKDLLEKYKINILPVVNRINQIVGLASWNDLNNNPHLIEPIIFMVGGRGARLVPITNKTPKPMIKIHGVPMLEKLVLKARSEGFKNFYFITNYLADKIIKHFKNGNKLNVNIKYIKEIKPLGTAGGLGLESFKYYKTAIVSNGDVLTEVSYKNLLLYHQNSKNDLTIGVKNIKTVNPYGVIKFTKSKKIKNLIEKPVQNNYVSAGVYVFETKLFSFIKKNNRIDMTSLINFFIKKNKKIGACPIHENWIDIGTHSDLSKII